MRIDVRARAMSASTASSAGRFAWMSEMSAYRTSARRASGRHMTVADAGHALTELLRLPHGRRHRFARRLHEAEAREVALGRRREQIQRADPLRLRLRDDALDELAAEPAVAPLGRDGGRAQQRVLAAHLEAHDAHDLLVALRHDERAEQRLRDSSQRQARSRRGALDGGEIARRCADAERRRVEDQIDCVMCEPSQGL